jgi:hypothetical protein
MRTLNIIPLILAGIVLLASKLALANDDKYVAAMQKNIETVYNAEAVTELQNAVNTFQRIGEAEKTRWEPFYYASFGYIMMANRENEPARKDTYLDLALKGIEKAKELSPGESEIVALEGFVHMIRLTVDPATRGQQYSSLAFQAFGKAVAMNPENPRALSLLAQMQYGTAQFFGSPTTEACVTLATALNKFETYKSDNVLAPQWGRGMAEGLKSKCN